MVIALKIHRLATRSLGDDGVADVGDSCRFTCNTGCRPQGIDTRFCQNDGWKGTDLDFACLRSK